jgi:hypothetical protein
METLAPRAAYDRDELGITDGLPLRAGLFYGSFMGLFEFVQRVGDWGVGGALISALIFGALAGAVFGLLFPRMLRVGAKRVNDRLYAGDLRLLPPPPKGYRYRLPCGWMAASTRAVNGVLYLGPAGARFDPVRRAPKRFRQGVALGPARALWLSRAEVPLPLGARIFGAQSAPRIDIHDETGSAQFTVPITDATYARLSEALQSLKREQEPSSA